MDITKVATAQSKSQSLRTTIPASIVRQFDLKPKDGLVWHLVARDSRFIIEVSPVKTSDFTEVSKAPQAEPRPNTTTVRPVKAKRGGGGQ